MEKKLEKLIWSLQKQREATAKMESEIKIIESKKKLAELKTLLWEITRGRHLQN
jgi:hypothetical protein